MIEVTRFVPQPLRTYKHVMIDLETLGTAPGSALLSIGAVAFNFGMPEPDWARLHVAPISRASCARMGLTEDTDTLAWWAAQTPEARQLVDDASLPGAFHIVEAISFFRDFYPASARIWGNGANFDNVLLRAVFDRVAMPAPWPYYFDHCYRTMKNSHRDVTIPAFQGVKHDALADALHQTRHLQLIAAKVGFNE